MTRAMAAQPFFVPAVLFVAFSLPLVFGVVPPNRFYGFRTRQALGSRRAWLAVNRYGGKAVVIASGVYLVTAGLLPWERTSPGEFRIWLVHLVAFAVPLAGALVATSRKSRTFRVEK